jgi:allophanate hydrolase subunit 2
MSAGDVLPCRPGRTPERFIRREEGGHSVTLRAVAGPQADWFDVGAFFGREFAVSGSGNRMGLRLVGPALPVAGREMVSEPVCPGAVQVTRDGGCIVLGVDGQTIGGYPRVAQVIAADLDKVGQLRPGDAIRFVRVGLDEAETAFRAKRAELGRWLTRLAVAELFGT